MKNIVLIFSVVFIFSCGNEKELQLPQIEKASITELQDVSAAYLFYDETQPDSVSLNRKNLISTTNWLVNVDKRLTLKQAIPHIKFLQDKKKSSSHKNEKAKNYFTCHDLSRNNLGFLEFNYTDFEIVEEKAVPYLIQPMDKESHRRTNTYHAMSTLSLIINIKKEIKLGGEDIVTIDHLKQKLDFFVKEHNFLGFALEIFFDQNLTFQDYISIKSQLNTLQSEVIGFSHKEYIIN